MTTQEKRQYAAELMVSRKGKNSYTQGADRVYFFGKPDNQVGNTTQKGYSDCSSAVRAAIKAAAGIDIGSNTSAQINNRSKGQIVHQTDGYYPDMDVLLPGDCLYFKGNSSHPLDVGHVEMYIGDGKCCGHGSGTGPKVRGVRDYCASRASSTRRYFMTIRWIQDDAEDAGNDGAAVPDVPDYMTFEIASGTWNVRTGPGTKYESVGKLKGGTKVEGVDTDGWIPIIYKGEVRWIGPSTVKKGV